MLAPLTASSSTLSLPYLGYDPSTFELAGMTPHGLRRYDAAARSTSFAQRVAEEKARRELAVYYYRINHTMAFPLPLAARPGTMPEGIPGRSSYPWLTWLSWALEERWRLLLGAWTRDDDASAGELLQQELAALAGWESFVEWNDEAGLGLGHIAGVLAMTLQQGDRLDPNYAGAIRQAATHLLEHDTLPWYARHWGAIAEPVGPNDLHNIPMIALVRSAQLARVLGHASVSQLEATAKMGLAGWCRLRVEQAAPHTEGTAYDGYLMDSVSEWLTGLPDKAELLTAHKAAFLSMVEHWLALALPGRVDLQVPIADVEPEMPFWMSVLARISTWYAETADNGGRWLWQHLPPDRMPAAALVWSLDHAELLAADAAAPSAAAPQVVPNAVVLRTGWDSEDCLVAVGAGHSRMSHLHQDSGTVVISRQDRVWLTDPGYQQYRRGEERDFTMGDAAHNYPVINGVIQSVRAAQVEEVATHEALRYVRLDLSLCYADLPATGRVLRHVWLDVTGEAGNAPLVVLADELQGFAAGTDVSTAWQYGTHLTWAFPEGWARLSDGARTLWVSQLGTSLSPRQLTRHAGSRGPLTLLHSQKLAQASQVLWWVFQFQPDLGWTPPTLDLTSIRRHAGDSAALSASLSTALSAVLPGAQG